MFVKVSVSFIFDVMIPTLESLEAVWRTWNFRPTVAFILTQLVRGRVQSGMPLLSFKAARVKNLCVTYSMYSDHY